MLEKSKRSNTRIYKTFKFRHFENVRNRTIRESFHSTFSYSIRKQLFILLTDASVPCNFLYVTC